MSISSSYNTFNDQLAANHLLILKLLQGEKSKSRVASKRNINNTNKSVATENLGKVIGIINKIHKFVHILDKYYILRSANNS